MCRSVAEGGCTCWSDSLIILDTHGELVEGWIGRKEGSSYSGGMEWEFRGLEEVGGKVEFWDR